MAEFLRPDKTVLLIAGGKTLTVNQKIIPDSLRAAKDVASYVRKGQPMKPCKPIGTAGKPLGVTVHNTDMIKVAAGTNAAEQYTRATYNGNMAGVVVHYYVWRGEVWQLLRLNERGWHATDGSSRRAGQRKGRMIGGNLDTIAIEAIGSDKATEDATALLCAWLCKEFGLSPALDIYQHNYFYPAKNCPAYIRPRWPQFIAQVEGISLPAATEEPPQGAAEAVYAPTLDDLRVKPGDKVRIKPGAANYWPGGPALPAAKWLREGVLTVGEISYKGQVVIKGGAPCVLILESGTWTATQNLEKI